MSDIIVDGDRILLPNTEALPLTETLSFRAFPLAHGTNPTRPHHGQPSTLSSSYESTAFFYHDDKTGQEALFFGDVEADSISKQALNRTVWEYAAPKIVAGILSTIFLECSYPVCCLG